MTCLLVKSLDPDVCPSGPFPTPFWRWWRQTPITVLNSPLPNMYVPNTENKCKHVNLLIHLDVHAIVHNQFINAQIIVLHAGKMPNFPNANKFITLKTLHFDWCGADPIDHNTCRTVHVYMHLTAKLKINWN